MGILGWALGGGSGLGPSSVYDILPFKGWRETSTWLEEAVDAIGLELDYRNVKFFRSSARANLLDPTYTPGSSDVADANIANATTAPSSAVSRDSMLDVLLYIALGIYPADSNLTVAQKQALVQTGWNALRRKGNRIRLLELASKIGDGIAVGWTVPPFNFSIILPDGAPSPGWGSWVQPTGSTSETSRPWILSGIRNMLAPMTPSFISLGVGYSQFRAGYSSAGETVFPSGARINLLNNEHFSTWSIGVPTSWSKVGSATLTQSTSANYINWEYTGSAAVFDLTATAIGNRCGLTQTASQINNQLTHRFQLDYAYSNSQNASVLTVQITDVNRDGNTYYWNNSTNAWQLATYTIAIPPSATRTRFACDVVPQATASGTAFGTSAINLLVAAKYDGTTTTATTYTIYRAGLYEKFSLTAEQATTGERTLWLPLVDGPGWSSASRTAGGIMLEPSNADRSAYRLTASTTTASFPYHPALGGHGFRAHGTWTNLVKGSNDFGADWTLTNATRTANAAISPIVGETVASASTLTATSTAAKITQTALGTPTNKTYCGGVWVKKLSTDGNFNDVKLSLVSTSTKTTSYTLTQAAGWQLLPFTATFSGTDLAALQLQIAWGAASSNGQIAIADAYLYDVTSNTGVLYPPVVRSGVGATATLNATACQALTANQNVNVLHPLTQRTEVSVVKGTLGLTIVPTLDAGSQPNASIFDTAQNATTNRIALRINSNALELRRWDGSGNQWVTSLTLTKSPSPASGSMTWLRDTTIQVRCLWDSNSTQLSAGNANATPGTKPGSWNPSDTSVAAVGIGNDWQTISANQFEGIVTLLDVNQLGSPTS